MNRLERWLTYAWASPASALGLLVALLAADRGASVAIVDGVLEVAGTRLAKVLARWARLARFNAITLGHVVIGASPAVLAHCRAHERVHVRQYERFGVLFFPLYAASSGLQWLRGRRPYWDNHFEREARLASAATCAPALSEPSR
jgi:hypothetical protein